SRQPRRSNGGPPRPDQGNHQDRPALPARRRRAAVRRIRRLSQSGVEECLPPALGPRERRMIATADRDFILQRQAFYARHLRGDVLPWWLENAIDEQHGGVFTYWDGAGDARTLGTTNKYVW